MSYIPLALDKERNKALTAFYRIKQIARKAQPRQYDRPGSLATYRNGYAIYLDIKSDARGQKIIAWLPEGRYEIWHRFEYDDVLVSPFPTALLGKYGVHKVFLGKSTMGDFMDLGIHGKVSFVKILSDAIPNNTWWRRLHYKYRQYRFRLQHLQY